MERREVNPPPDINPKGQGPSDERHDPTHPLVRGRTEPVLDVLDELAAAYRKDPIGFKSLSRMIGGE